MVSGMASGIICTAITHPFEIIRAELQTHELLRQSKKSSILTEVVNLVKSGEALKGVAPRLIKKPLTNTLAIVMFEFMEKHHGGKQI